MKKSLFALISCLAIVGTLFPINTISAQESKNPYADKQYLNEAFPKANLEKRAVKTCSQMRFTDTFSDGIFDLDKYYFEGSGKVAESKGNLNVQLAAIDYGYNLYWTEDYLRIYINEAITGDFIAEFELKTFDYLTSTDSSYAGYIGIDNPDNQGFEYAYIGQYFSNNLLSMNAGATTIDSNVWGTTDIGTKDNKSIVYRITKQGSFIDLSYAIKTSNITSGFVSLSNTNESNFTGDLNISLTFWISGMYANDPILFQPIDNLRVYCPTDTQFNGYSIIGGTSKEVAMATVTGGTGTDKLFQAVRGNEGHIWTRSTENGTTWTGWQELGATPNSVGMAAVEDKLFQAVRGTEGWLWTRIFDNDTQTWSSWNANGGTSGNIAMVANGTKLFQSIRGNDGLTYTRIYDNTTGNWSSWVASKATPSTPSLASVGTKVFQAVRGTDNLLYFRIYDTTTSTWGNWTLNGGTSDEVAMAGIGTKLFMSVKGNEKWLWTNIYDTTTSTWSGWVANGGTANVPSLAANTNNKLYQAVTGNDNQVWVRSYNVGTSTWGEWLRMMESTLRPTITEFQGTIYVATKDHGGFINFTKGI